ncbi:MAG: UDP-N-acetylmuramoyl-tripeptide--D-alanyl-D-alanine ligase [Clostridia bacterium]|jgi:UDP-N-acetylmuramoyl-tripeptide--D-alanyl-D-alanine ligase|nr:UDP-N-acetylmuramoyl-tripeptide--D-alanyl-D-alanine ligase [Clostridia bacterium]
MRIELAYPLSLKEIAEYTNSEMYADNKSIIKYITTDTREIEEGDLFVAIRGETFDGNEYAEKALSLGATAVLCDRVARGASDEKMLLCADTVKALGALSREYLSLHRKKTVAITGSVGKTTTKEFIYSVLKEKFKVHKTEGNHNNELGLPYTVLSIKEDTEILVTEMGMCGRGEIEYLSDIVKPDVSVITMIGSSHLEHLGTRENICDAKMEIVSGMSENGILFLNGDEPLLRRDYCKKYSPKYLSLKNTEDSDFLVNNISTDGETTSFELVIGESTYNMQAYGIGRHIAQAAAFGAIVGRAFGMNEKEIVNGLLKFRTEKMRQNVYKIGKITVIDDCYNASPESMRAASDVLSDLARRNGSRAVALLGDMRELGENTRVLHEGVGEYMAKNGLDLLFTFGLIAENYKTGAIRGGMTESAIFTNPDVASPDESGMALVRELREGDVLLIKASRAMAAEKIINYLENHINKV